jgi:CheY-like chemotaxis protein
MFALPADNPAAGELQQVMQAGRRARDLVKQILTFSRRSEPSRMALAMPQMVAETIDLLRTLAKGAVEFEVRMPENLPTVSADPVQVHQVLMNIGTNAVQAMRGTRGRLIFLGEALTVGPELSEQHASIRPGYYVRLGVQDTGPGMTPELQRRVFEPFFTTKAPGEGTGLGLSVVHGIMQQHGGGITLYSQPGRGTLFHLYFPVNPASEASTPIVGGDEVPASENAEQILLVDDDPVVVETADRILRRLGYSVHAHGRADDAWTDWSAAPDAFDLIVSDLTMPGTSGLQLLAQVRALRASQPFLLVSGFFSDAETAEARSRGVSGLVPKPLSYELLGRAVAEVLKRRPD